MVIFFYMLELIAQQNVPLDDGNYVNIFCSTVVQRLQQVKANWLPLANANGDVLTPEDIGSVVVPCDEVQELRDQEEHPLSAVMTQCSRSVSQRG